MRAIVGQAPNLPWWRAEKMTDAEIRAYNAQFYTEIEMTELPKFSKDFSCPKCGSDKCGTRLDEQPGSAQDHERRRRLDWPLFGELMVQSCQICGHVKVSRPLDYQLTTTTTGEEK